MGFISVVHSVCISFLIRWRLLILTRSLSFIHSIIDTQFCYWNIWILVSFIQGNQFPLTRRIIFQVPPSLCFCCLSSSHYCSIIGCLSSLWSFRRLDLSRNWDSRSTDYSHSLISISIIPLHILFIHCISIIYTFILRILLLVKTLQLPSNRFHSS